MNEQTSRSTDNSVATPLPESTETSAQARGAQALTLLAMLLGMSAFEALTQYLFPRFTSWELHGITILFSGGIAYLVAGFVMRRQDVLRLGLAQEIERQRVTEDALRHSEERKTAFFSSSLDCIISIDAEGDVIEFNPAAERTFGYTVEQAIGHSLASLIIPRDQRDAHQRGMQHFLATGEGPILNKRIEIVAVKSNGTEFWVELAVVPTCVDGRWMFTAYLRDISKRKQAEAERDLAEAALREAHAELDERVRHRTAELASANDELRNAYDATIAGWSRALDLRDKETQGHSERVADVTVQLARAMGVDEELLVHVRRGALIHDIGKMGVPDQILLKPGPLTDDEWRIMRLHPTYAYEMLSPIEFLRPALEIPYGHHEKWDGSGYPEGLIEESIPLAARIFAVVDVWDALRSDRPYRPAWPEDKVCDYLAFNSGSHFDPEVVKCFLAMNRALREPVRQVA